MSLPETHTIEIKVRNAAAYTLNNVVATARSCSPQDLKIAAANVELYCAAGGTPAEVTDFVNFLVTDLFTLFHRSGLYNRQRALWEAIARAVKVTVQPVTQGFFRKEILPMFDVHFEDASGGTTLLALIVQNHAQWTDPKYVIAIFKELLHRAQQMDRKRPSLKAIMIVAPKPFPEELFKQVEKMLGGPSLDPVSRYESVLPAPITVHIDLFEYGVAAGEINDKGSAPAAETHEYEAAEIDDPAVIGDEVLLHPDDMNGPSHPGRFFFRLVQPDVEKARKK